jgi:acyl dehydratase
VTIDPVKVAAYRIGPHAGSCTARDAVLYALGVGLGHDPVDREALAFVMEEWGPKVLPTFATVIGDPNQWLADPKLGIRDYPNVHGDETITLHAPIPAACRVTCQSRIAGLYDRGPGSHAILIVEEEMAEAETGRPLATLRQTDVLIGAGGFGGEPPPAQERPAMPEREPDHVASHPVAPQAALIYRLSGDHYALHVEPAFARAAGFDGPILHGLATYGIACHAVVAACCHHDPGRIARFHGRFTAPVYPGEALSTRIWRDGPIVRFETYATARNVVVLGNGRADLRDEVDGDRL